MSDLVNLLGNLRSLRAAINLMDLERAELALEKFQLLVAEKREQEAAKIEEQKARQALIEKYQAELKQNGISLTDLGLSVTEEKVRKPRRKVEPKYQYTDENGEARTWAGQGRTPRAIAAALKAGKTLEDFKI